MNLAEILHPEHSLYQRTGDGPLIDLILKGVPTRESASKQHRDVGEKELPFDVGATISLQNSNVHHSTCLETKASALTGLGFESEKTTEVLDEACGEDGIQDLMNDIAQDFVHVGNAYMEVVREGEDLFLHHIPATDVTVVLENDDFDIHYLIRPGSGGAEKRWPRFGDLDAFIARNDGISADEVSEVIHLKRASSMSRWYGFPDWLAAVASIELVQCFTQYTFDFFFNRGVPEFIAAFLGGTIPPDDWDRILKKLEGTIGYGRSHKSLAVNLTDPNLKLDVIKLAMESRGDNREFASLSDTLAMQIVSAHRVPPLLAGILVPGKLGATNEVVNAMMAFQTLVIRQMQQSVSSKLGATLGNPKLNGKLGLGRKDFKFRTILDEFDLEKMGTIGSMRQELPTAQAEGRDLSQGLRKEEEEEIGLLLGQLFSSALPGLIRRLRAA